MTLTIKNIMLYGEDTKVVIDMERLLTVKETQDILRIGRNSMYKLLAQRGFPKLRIGNKYMVIESKLDQYILEHNKSQIILN